MKIFKLDRDQVKQLKKWQKAIKHVHGKYGTFEYKFTPTALCTTVKVYSKLTNTEIDLTDTSKW